MADGSWLIASGEGQRASVKAVKTPVLVHEP